MVSTRIDRPSGPPVEAQWRVRDNAGQPRIIDVMVAGISMVTTQRDEFAAVVQRQKVAGLIEVLRARTSKLPATR
jgi:phospholipid transport system substrate-binding protein